MSLMSYVEYRFDALGYTLAQLVWFTFAFIYFNVIFSNTSQIRGWRYEDMLLLYAVDELIMGLFLIIFWSKISGIFLNGVVTGKIDREILKPSNTRFNLSVGGADLPGIFLILQSSSLLLYTLIKYDYNLGFVNVFLTTLLLINGLLALYNICFLVMCVQFWSTNFNQASIIFWNIQRFGKRPLNLFPRFLELFFTYIIPIGFISYIPVKAYLGLLDTRTIMLAFILNITLFVISEIIFQRGLKRYDSAGG